MSFPVLNNFYILKNLKLFLLVVYSSQIMVASLFLPLLRRVISSRNETRMLHNINKINQIPFDTI